jgi:hypothetical protein
LVLQWRKALLLSDGYQSVINPLSDGVSNGKLIVYFLRVFPTENLLFFSIGYFLLPPFPYPQAQANESKPSELKAVQQE